MKQLRTYLIVLLIICCSTRANSQTLTYQFIDPCTKVVTFFSVPAQGTVVFFLGQSRQFTSSDVSSGAFATWVNQVYADYSKISPCGVQSGQVTQNQITSQIVSSTVQSVVGSIMSQAQSAASGVAMSSSSSGSSGGDDAASKGKTQSDNKKKAKSDAKSNNNSNNNNNASTSSSSSSTQSSGTSQTSTQNGQANNQTSTTNNQTSSNNTQTSTANSSGTGSSNSSSNVGTSNSGNSSNPTGSGSNKKTGEKSEEVAATTTMNVDARQDKGGDSENSSGGSKGGKSGNSRSNPMIVQSDLTTAQNLDKSFTPILNLGMSQSSMTGMSSWGITSMTWLNFKQFALSGRYTKIQFNKTGSLKFIHNFNLTAVYTYGNILAFLGYSGILNAGKWGVTGFNVSAASTIVAQEDNTYFSPSITAFYTKPFMYSKRLTISPEIYIISTPLIYSSKDRVTTTDRTFSGFLGSGFDYQITKRFKFNVNYKANLSTNPDFPILSFFLIGSKINL